MKGYWLYSEYVRVFRKIANTELRFKLWTQLHVIERETWNRLAEIVNATASGENRKSILDFEDAFCRFNPAMAVMTADQETTFIEAIRKVQ